MITAAFALLFPLFSFFSTPSIESPLSEFSAAWSESKYYGANTAANANYMSAEEKEVIHILNLVKMNPQLFYSTVILKYPAHSNNPGLKDNPYFKSLLKDMQNQKPLSILQPEQKLFISAECHAKTSGMNGYVGHERLNTACNAKKVFYGECISYGYNDALDIVMALLIDKNVPGVGHRKLFLSDYKTVGVSIQPHTTYRYNAVIDFGY